MTINLLNRLEKQASSSGLILRIKVGRPLNLWSLRLVVGKYIESEKVQVLGEMKGWAYHSSKGLQLDTMMVRKHSPTGIGHLVWAATMAWALEETPCRSARLLAIHDEERQHKKLIRYFQIHGFKEAKEVGSSPLDLPLRMVWGGAGTLMNANCLDVYEYNYKFWKKSQKNNSKQK